MGEYLPWEEFLGYLRGPGIAVVVAVVLSFILEYWPAFVELAPRWKRLVFAGLCFAVPLLGTVLACASGFEVWGDFAEVWWPVLWAGGAAFFAGQMVHLRRLPGGDDLVPVEVAKREGPHW